ncbi:hypothetical protein GALMADRAFT_230784 [Galerina marginata CBS 339.88]|uniref:F-box domain-containing protein n=1 Tax=Galerina marginata (strain CBS 339.88) TaxID=685588 RepID=A0A067SGY6_GALM3|nr:hypothetical protein GALMADRAFT_230784 [Galerina marginata CBS 339.88]
MSNTDFPGELPQEIYDETIGLLRDDPDALRACALAFRQLLPTSQKLLFKRLALLLGSRILSLEYLNGPRLERILADSPHIGSYVEFLEISEATDVEAGFNYTDYSAEQRRASKYGEYLSRNLTLAFCLPRFCRLKCLSLQYRHMSGSARTVLENTFRQSTLTCINIHSMHPFILQRCRNMKHLSICPLDYDDPPKRTPGIDRPVLESLHITLNQRLEVITFVHTLTEQVINISHLKKLFVVCKDGALSHATLWNLLLGSKTSLEELVFDPCLEAVRHPIAIPRNYLNFGILKALRRMRIRLAMTYRPINPICSMGWFVGIFRTMPLSKENCLEELTIEVIYKSIMTIDTAPWSELFTLLATPDRFPCFKKLRVTILSFRDGQAEEIISDLESCLIDLRETGISVELLVAGQGPDYLSTFWPDTSWNSILI